METNEKAARNTVVGATDEQQISKNDTQIIAEDHGKTIQNHQTLLQ